MKSKILINTAKLIGEKGNEMIKIKFPFSYETLNKVKTLVGRKYVPEGKYWVCPLCEDNVEKLKKWGFRLDDSLSNYFDKENIAEQFEPVRMPELKGELYEFQKQGVQFIENHKGKALIADEMGLGKTIQAIAYMQLHKNMRPVITVCPASLKHNWKNEIEKWTEGSQVQVLQGTDTNIFIDAKIIILNYDILHAWVDVLLEWRPQLLVLDEVHYIKNSNAKRTKAVKKLAKKIDKVIALSGTPITNRPVEIYNVVKLINPSLFPDRWHFLHRYCAPKHNGFGWDFNGASNTEELHRILTGSLMIRRLKKDVLTELPEKTRSIIPVELDNWSVYEKAELDFIQYVQQRVEQDVKTKARMLYGEQYENIVKIDDEKLEELKEEKASKVNMLSKIEGLKQIAMEGKIKTAMQWIKDFLENENKLVVFCTHRKTIDLLEEGFKNKCVRFDGSLSMDERQRNIHKFQNNKNINLFLGMLDSQGKPSGVGITLTAASHTLTLELQWSPGVHDQAEDRCHRISQKNNVVNYYMIGKNTIEEKIAALLDRKRKVLDNVLDGKETDNRSLLTELLNEYYEK